MHRGMLPTHSGTAGRNTEKEGMSSTLLCCLPVLAVEEEEEGGAGGQRESTYPFSRSCLKLRARETELSLPTASFPAEEVEAHTLMHWG